MRRETAWALGAMLVMLAGCSGEPERRGAVRPPRPNGPVPITGESRSHIVAGQVTPIAMDRVEGLGIEAGRIVVRGAPANLALVRLGLEAASLEATATGLPGDVRAEQIGLWRSHIEQRLLQHGFSPRDASIEASLTKAMFTGLIIDLLATGEKRRLTSALEVALARLDEMVDAAESAKVPA